MMYELTTAELWPRQSPLGVYEAVRQALVTTDLAVWSKLPVLLVRPKAPPPEVPDLRLGIICSAPHGFSILWFRKGGEAIRDQGEMVSVGDISRLDEFIDHPVQDAVCIGSCVSGQIAARVLEDFARKPTVLSGAVQWRPAYTLNYPLEVPEP